MTAKKRGSVRRENPDYGSQTDFPPMMTPEEVAQEELEGDTPTEIPEDMSEENMEAWRKRRNMPPPDPHRRLRQFPRHPTEVN